MAPVEGALPVCSDQEEMVVGKRVDIANLALDPIFAGQIRSGHGCVGIASCFDEHGTFGLSLHPLGIAVQK